MSDLATRLREHVDTAAPPIEVEALVDQLQQEPGLTTVHPVRYRIPSWGYAIAAAVVVLVVIGGAALIFTGPQGSDPVDTPVPPVTVATAVPTTVLEAAGAGYSVTQILDAPYVVDVALDPQGVPWVVVKHFDQAVFDEEYANTWSAEDPLTYLNLNFGWSLLQQASEGWRAVVEEPDMADLNSRFGFSGPQILGIRPDGGVWLHDLGNTPQGGFVLWEYKDGGWTDHTEAANLPGPWIEWGPESNSVRLGCCPMGMTPEGDIWVHSGAVWKFDSDISSADDESHYDGTWHLAETGYPLNLGSTVSEGVSRDDVRWVLNHDWEESGTWNRSMGGQPFARFPVDYDRLEDSLTCSPLQDVFDLHTESVITSDGALWTAWPCIGVTRIDPYDGSMTLINDGLPSADVWRIAMGHDDSIWVGGKDGLVKITPKAP